MTPGKLVLGMSAVLWWTRALPSLRQYLDGRLEGGRGSGDGFGSEVLAGGEASRMFLKDCPIGAVRIGVRRLEVEILLYLRYLRVRGEGLTYGVLASLKLCVRGWNFLRDRF